MYVFRVFILILGVQDHLQELRIVLRVTARDSQLLQDPPHRLLKERHLLLDRRTELGARVPLLLRSLLQELHPLLSQRLRPLFLLQQSSLRLPSKARNRPLLLSQLRPCQPLPLFKVGSLPAFDSRWPRFRLLRLDSPWLRFRRWKFVRPRVGAGLKFDCSTVGALFGGASQSSNEEVRDEPSPAEVSEEALPASGSEESASAFNEEDYVWTRWGGEE